MTIAFAVLAAFGGWRLGLITRAVSWAGMILGVLVAARVVPPAVESVERSGGRSEVLLVALVLLVGGAFLGQALGLWLGRRIEVGRRSAVAHRVDAVGGAVAGVLGVLVAVWLLVPAIADVPGWQSRQARTSTVARAVERIFPEPPDATQTVRRLLGGQYPSVVDALRPTPEVGPPPPASGLDRATSDRVVRSTVKLIGEACNRIQEGSGFVVRPGQVVTNAHVVAGVESSTIERSDGSRTRDASSPSIPTVILLCWLRMVSTVRPFPCRHRPGGTGPCSDTQAGARWSSRPSRSADGSRPTARTSTVRLAPGATSSSWRRSWPPAIPAGPWSIPRDGW
ncbi:MAG: CvpA family protein [Acidimicrobiales bacterium]